MSKLFAEVHKFLRGTFQVSCKGAYTRDTRRAAAWMCSCYDAGPPGRNLRPPPMPCSDFFSESVLAQPASMYESSSASWSFCSGANTSAIIEERKNGSVHILSCKSKSCLTCAWNWKQNMGLIALFRAFKIISNKRNRKSCFANKTNKHVSQII